MEALPVDPINGRRNGWRRNDDFEGADALDEMSDDTDLK